jgi:TRAP-type mannitol/chloroaromatic compound transport system permease small subunit
MTLKTDKPIKSWGEITVSSDAVETVPSQGMKSTYIIRVLGWVMLAVMATFVVNNFLTFGAGLPGADGIFKEGASAVSWLQALSYVVLAGLAIVLVSKRSDKTLRQDSLVISNFNTVFIRCAFWVVLIVGIVDMGISFLRVEGMLPAIFGEDLASQLGKSQFRGIYVHVPLMLLGIVLGFVTRTLGFTWLTLLIVAAELMIVISRFIFSYEQAFMADLVRFWYGALFLFASAFTLLEEGHVRVDVFYAGFKDKTKGMINAIGSIFLGLTLCWTILIVGMGGKSSVINSPVFNFEVTQSGFGMYVKYMMAGFLGVFAISMMIQFIAYLMDAVADYRNDPHKIKPAAPGAH